MDITESILYMVYCGRLRNKTCRLIIQWPEGQEMYSNYSFIKVMAIMFIIDIKATIQIILMSWKDQ